MPLFLVIVLGIWAAMHAYAFWRIGSVPWVAVHISWPWRVVAGVVFWASFPLSRLLRPRLPESLGWVLEFASTNWIGVLFLLCAALLVTDVGTLGGSIWRQYVGRIRGAAIVAGLALSVVAMIQAARSPVARECEVFLKGLPPERDGLVLALLSDLHLGSMTSEAWLEEIVSRVNATRPDVILLVGDIVDGDVRRVEPFAARIRQFSAPLGVWAVTGNHEYYAGVDASVRLLEGCGITVLRDRSQEVASGLVLAGVDDFTARLQFGGQREGLKRALSANGTGATVLLSHSPLRAEQAASLGARLMLCGHTHDGQIWPFKYLVKLRYRWMSGRFEVNGMTMLVCRGTGTWGPRMRLWQPSEMVFITLRSAPAANSPPL